MRDVSAIYTIGHGSRTKEEFLELLTEHDIGILVDVRRWPKSKIPHFTGGSMEEWLKAAGVRYIWMGERLGGYRRGGYYRYMKTSNFQRGVEELLEAAGRSRVCLMCLEVSPKGCHRRFISTELNRRGVDVIHILSKVKILEAPAGSDKII